MNMFLWSFSESALVINLWTSSETLPQIYSKNTPDNPFENPSYSPPKNLPEIKKKTSWISP